MTSDVKIGLLVGLVFIFVIAFIINGLPNLGNQSQAGATPIMSSEDVEFRRIFSGLFTEETPRISPVSRDWIVQKAKGKDKALSDLTKLNRAIALLACMANEPSIAKDAVDEALVLAPGDSNLLIWKGNLHLFQEELTEARMTYERAIDVAKGSGNRRSLAAAYRGIGIIHMRIRRTAEAEANLNQAVSLYTELSMKAELEETNRLLGQLQAEKGRGKE